MRRISASERVRKVLHKRGLSIADLARMAGLKYHPLVEILLDYRPPSDAIKEKTARALGLSPARLWGPDSGKTK